jgi:hypothetical protein
MSASQDQYTDLNTVKAFLSLSDTDTSQDLFITTIIPMVQTFIDRFTGRSFGWGDEDSSGQIVDDINTDWSNSDCLSVDSFSGGGATLTVNTIGPHPFVAGQNVALYGSSGSHNGVWAVTARNNAQQFVVDTTASKGALPVSRTAIGTSINGYCGSFVTTYKYIQQEQHDGFAGNTLYLRNMDIRSVDSVYLGLRNSGQPALLDPSQYVWQDDGRLILGGSYFNTYDSNVYNSGGNGSSFYGEVASGTQTVMVNYWHGYIGVPPELTLAATDLVLGYYTLRKGMGIQRERTGDYDVQYDVTFRKLLQEQPDSLNTLNILKRRHV